MSFNIRSIREISNDPLTKFTNQLAKKLSKFLTDQQIDKLEDREDIYSDGQDVETAIYFNEFQHQQQFDFQTEYYTTFEPDGSLVTCIIKGDNMGNEIIDHSGFNNDGALNGDPILVDGTPFDYGTYTQGTKSIALRFNRPTSPNENGEWIQIPHATNLSVSGITTGISYFIRFKIHSLAQQGSADRTLFEKTDDSTPDNGVQVQVTSTGRIQVSIKRAGTEYNNQTDTGTITAGTVYEVFITYANSGNTVHVYVNNVDKTLSAGSSPTWHSTLTNSDLCIFRKGLGTSGGFVYGDLYDFTVYREKVVTSTEVGYHYTNKWSITDIPYGQVMVTNYWATYDETP